MTSPSLPSATRAVRLWLYICCGMVLMVAAAGAFTRLTDSGLSITVWRPFGGVAPPLSAAAWEEAFSAYRALPHYAHVHEGMTLAGFRVIFFIEYFHRLGGRVLGFMFLLPFLWFARRGALERRTFINCGVALALGAVQGYAGWYMVKSGLGAEAGVSHLRLGLHFTLALSIYALLLATALRLTPSPPQAWRLAPRAGLLVKALPWTAAATMILGALVAGSGGGHIYATFPLMEGEFVPADGWALRPWPRNLFDNPATLQFLHRCGAFAVFLLAFAAVVAGWRKSGRSMRKGLVVLAVFVSAQFVLGVVTLLSGVALGFALFHHAGAFFVFTAALLVAVRAGGTRGTA